MIDAHTPQVGTMPEPIETQEESPLIQAIKNFRDRFFSAKKNQEEIPETDEQLIEKLYGKYGFRITPQELSEIRRSANGVGLVDNAGILKFVVTVPNILFDLENIHRIEKGRAGKLKDPLELKRWQAEVNTEIDWALATYEARYSAKQKPNYNPIIDERLTLRLREDETDDLAVESEISAEAAPQESQSNVIRLVDHPHKPTQPLPSEKSEDDGPEPTQPKTNVA